LETYIASYVSAGREIPFNAAVSTSAEMGIWRYPFSLMTG
jgi:hypothetical protein